MSQSAPLAAVILAFAVLVFWWRVDDQVHIPEARVSDSHGLVSTRSDNDPANEPARILPAIVSSDSSTEDKPGPQDETTTPPVEIVWSRTPEELEGILRTALLSGSFDIGILDDLACSTTRCEVFISKDDAGSLSNATIRFGEFVRGAPINACGVGTRTDRKFDGTYQQRVSMTTCSEEKSQIFRVASLHLLNQNELSRFRDELLRFQEEQLSLDDYDADPVVVSDRNGIRLVVENICSVDCPLDVQQIMYWESSEGSSCEEIVRGTPQLFEHVRNDIGEFENRTMCVPMAYEWRWP